MDEGWRKFYYTYVLGAVFLFLIFKFIWLLRG